MHRDLKPDLGGVCQHSEVVEGKATATIVFDSTFDKFTDDRQFDNVVGREDIAFVGFTTDGDVFGAFFIFAVTKQNIPFFDPTMFGVSFESNGRCETPQRFVVKESLKDEAYVQFRKDDNNLFAVFGCLMVPASGLGNRGHTLTAGTCPMHSETSRTQP